MNQLTGAPARIGILYPSDPLGHVPSGIDAFVRGILKFAPHDLAYTLLGATSDPAARPAGVECDFPSQGGNARFMPLVPVDATGSRGRIPLIVRFMWRLRSKAARALLSGFRVLDFHRIEPVWLFRHDPRPLNLLLHQDMSIVRDPDSDILWRHAPALYESLERRLLGCTDQVFCVRQSAVERYHATYPDLAGRIAFIPTWVDTDVFGPPPDGESRTHDRQARRQTLGVPPSARLLAFVGRFDRQKDPGLLLAAFAVALRESPDLHLVLIGDGVLREAIEKQVAAGGLGTRVHFLGARRPAEIAMWLRASDLFVLSSAYEGMPIAVLEALACGLPVASTDVGELKRVVRTGETGSLSPGREPAALARTILDVLADSGPDSADRCVAAIRPFTAAAVLGTIFDNHRRQLSRRRTP